MIGNTNSKYGIRVSDKDKATYIYSPDKTSKIEMTDNTFTYKNKRILTEDDIATFNDSIGDINTALTSILGV